MNTTDRSASPSSDDSLAGIQRAPARSVVSDAAFLRLLRAAQRGNARAQDALFTRYYPRVERIAHAQLQRMFGRRTSNLATRFSTADVVQEVFRSLVRTLDAFAGRTEGEFVVYVTRIVRSRVLDALRFHSASCRDYRRSKSPAARRSVADLLEALPAEAEPGAEPTDLRGRYLELLAEFDARTRTLVQERIEAGLGFAQLAERLDYPSRFAARRAFFAAQAQLVVRLSSAAPGAGQAAS